MFLLHFNTYFDMYPIAHLIFISQLLLITYASLMCVCAFFISLLNVRWFGNWSREIVIIDHLGLFWTYWIIGFGNLEFPLVKPTGSHLQRSGPFRPSLTNVVNSSRFKCLDSCNIYMKYGTQVPVYWFLKLIINIILCVV